MKTKKILAIVTLVAFMISILPMAAFAAVSPYTSIVSVETGSVAAAGADYIEIKVKTKDINYVNDNSPLFVVTNRPTADKIYNVTANDYIPPTGGKGVEVIPVAGEAIIKIKSNVPSQAIKVYIGTSDENIYKYAVGQDVSVIDAGALMYEGEYYVPVTFTAPKAGTLKLANITATPFANGVSYVEVSATLTSTSGTPVSGKDINFSVTPSGATLSESKATTNASGVAKVKVFATKPETYTVKVTASGVTEDTSLVSGENDHNKKVTFLPTGIVGIKAESDDNQKIAMDTGDTSYDAVEFKYTLTDTNGNKVNAAILDADYDDGTDSFKSTSLISGAEIRFITRPSGSAISEKPTIAGASDDINLSQATDGKLVVGIKKSLLNKEGEYALRLTLANGKSVTYTFNVKEQGTVTGMTVEYDATSYAAGTIVDSPDVKLVDAEGYTSKVAGNTGITFAVDNNKVVTTLAADGKLTTKADETGVVNVTAINSSKNLVATATLNFEKPASYLKFTAPTYTAVGEEASVKVQLVDIDGKSVSTNTAATSNAAIVIAKPEGAIVSTSVDASDFNKGEATLKVSSNVKGSVKVQLVITAGSNYTGSVDVNFGDVATAQKPLTMFIGATNYMVDGAPAVTDAAPFIQDGRTYVAVRPIGDALGTTIYWDEATQTVTMTKPGETVTVVIGAATIKVDRAGVVTEYPTDAPAQIKDGRTYLPFRAIGEAMGYAVYFDEATQSVSFK